MGVVIEFESDGVWDSLTGALAPARFQEILEDEIAIAVREGRRITLISLHLNLQSDVDLLAALKEFATALSPLMRRGDYLARISEYGFWILIRGDVEAAKIGFARVAKEIDVSIWRVHFCEAEVGEEMKNLLRRMDLIHFAK